MPVTKYTEEEANIFDNPKINIRRSKFNLSHTLTTSFGLGKLIPIFYEEVLPGDTFKVNTGLVARVKQAFIKPVMDPLYLDIMYFYVPNRIVWKHWKEFMGENNSTPWTPTTTYTVPKITMGPNVTAGILQQSPLHYLGLPLNAGNGTVISQLPLRAYWKIYNNFFLNQATQNPELEDDSDTNYTYNENSLSTLSGACACQYVNKYPDLFSRALPEPQRGDSMKIPFATNAPVKVNNTSNKMLLNDVGLSNGQSIGIDVYKNGTENYAVANNNFVAPQNLIADLSNATGTINELIQAYQVQRLLWTDGVYGGRYKEILYGHFGVTTSDKSLQIPEYLGGTHINLNTYQVVQNSSTDSTSAQGNISAFGYAENYSENFTKSFEEHGMILGFAVVRFKHSYQQGINKKFSKLTRYDYYWPELANLPDQPILRKELYATGASANDNAIFGYGEAWYEYKQNQNRVSGGMCTASVTSDDEYHWADYYNNAPVLANFSMETYSPTYFNRTTAYASSGWDAILLNVAFNVEATRPMPARSVPGFAIWG